MNIKRFFSSRFNILAFVTVMFVLIGLLFGFVVPNSLFNRQINSIEDRLHNLAVNHQNVTEVSSTQILYVYDNGQSSMLTSSGYIDVIDDDVEHHLIHWSHEQVAEDIQALLYEDDFQEKHYIYYVYVVNDEYYVVSYEDTKEVIMFVDSFRITSLVSIFILYILSMIFSGTIFSSSLIKQYSLFDPVTNLNTKISLLNRFKNKSLLDYEITYFNIYNLDNIIEAIGARYSDDVLKMISNNLSKGFGDKVYQISQKEYVLVDVVGSENFDVFQQVINRKPESFNQLEAYEFKSKCIHIKEDSLSDVSINTLLKRFSFAFSKIKSTKESVFYIDQNLIKEIEQEQYYQSRLSSAIKKGQMINFYQPKVDPATNTIIGAEALSRWKDGEDVISPAYYIHIAESNGMIYDIDLISFENSLKFIKELEEKDLLFENFKVSSNFSPITLKNIDFSQLRELMDLYKVDPKHISVEITETVVLEFGAIEELLKQLVELGVTIEIDDFSAGNSSFTMLSMLNANIVKLDRAILPENDEDEREKLIYHSLVDISKKLGLKIISEGVESDLQKTFVKKLGVEGVQGYFYSKPLQKDQFIEYVKSNT